MSTTLRFLFLSSFVIDRVWYPVLNFTAIEKFPPYNFEAHLLRLLGLELQELLLTALPVSLSAGLGVEAEVPPAEAGGVVADELLVVEIVVIRTGPEGDEVTQAPGEVVAAVGIDGLEETEDDPDVHGDEVEFASNAQQNNGCSNDTNSEKSGFDRRGVFSSETEGSRVGVVHLVNRLVERTVVQRSVEPVVPGVLHDEADGDLNSHLPDRRERNAVLHAQVGSDGVEEPDLRELGGEVADEDDGGAIPLFLEGGHLLSLNLVSAEIGNLVHNHKGNASTEVNELVEDEAQESGSESIVLHIKVPGLSSRVNIGESG